MWAGFAGFVLVALAIDLVVLDKKKGQKVGTREAAIWSLIWVALSFVFAGLLWVYLNDQHGQQFASLKTTEFLTGYLIESFVRYIFLLHVYFAQSLLYQ